MDETENNKILDYIYNKYIYLEDLLIIKEYQINPHDDWITKSKYFLLRYRRIIGIVMLSIIIYLALYCEPIEENTIVRRETIQNGGGGSNLDFGPFGFHAGETEAKAKSSRIESNKKRILEGHEARKQANAEIKQQEEAEIKQKQQKDASQKELERKTFKSLSYTDKLALKRQDSVSKFKETKTGQTLGKFAGKSKMGKTTMLAKGLGSGAYKVGAYVGETAKEYSQIFYQILFAVVITVCILMIFLPSLAFFFIGLVCYFLLKKKLENIKMF
jgi:hypothetical protein